MGREPEKHAGRTTGAGLGRPLLVGVAALAAGLVLARCGAEGVPAPPPPPEANRGQDVCGSLQGYMPRFFELLEDGRFVGLRNVVVALAKKEDPNGNPIASLLGAALKTMQTFTYDPPETGTDQCVPYDTTGALPHADSANRLCAMRRMLHFGVKDEQAAAALEKLRPLLAKVLGYITNNGAGADGREHYEGVLVLHGTSSAESICSPRNLLEVMDGLVVSFGAGPDCAPPPAGMGDDCPALAALRNTRDLVSHPKLQEFLRKFDGYQGSASGRAGFQALGRALAGAVAAMPEDETYFDPIDKLMTDVVYRYMDNPENDFGDLKPKVQKGMATLRAFLNPQRPGAVLRQLKAVVACVNAVDTENQLVGAIYDLMSRPGAGTGGGSGGGIDLAELVRTIEEVVRADQSGILAGAIHVILRETANDERAMSAIRRALVDLLELDNARRVLPVLQLMIEEKVTTELVRLLDNLLYGCRSGAVQGSP